MFYFRDNLFFGRLPNGDVRIVKFSSPPPDFPQVEQDFRDWDITLLDVTVDALSWCSVISSMSKAGESENWDRAKEFHGVT